MPKNILKKPQKCQKFYKQCQKMPKIYIKKCQKMPKTSRYVQAGRARLGARHAELQGRGGVGRRPLEGVACGRGGRSGRPSGVESSPPGLGAFKPIY